MFNGEKNIIQISIFYNQLTIFFFLPTLPQSLNHLFLGASDKFAHDLSEEVGLGNAGRLELDPTHFAQKFEDIMLRLENLTQHQQEIFDEMTKVLNDSGRVDIRAPAGAGKTFLGLKALLDVLDAGMNEGAGVVAFISRNKALCMQVSKWLYVRLQIKKSFEKHSAFLSNTSSKIVCCDIPYSNR